VGPKRPWRDWRGRYYLFGQRDTKDRRCKRSHRSAVANRNHNGQGINTWIGVGSLRARACDRNRPMICVSRRCDQFESSLRRPVSVICMDPADARWEGDHLWLAEDFRGQNDPRAPCLTSVRNRDASDRVRNIQEQPD
jgi:hypothetical protein